MQALARSKTELDRHVADSEALERDIASRAEQVRKVGGRHRQAARQVGRLVRL